MHSGAVAFAGFVTAAAIWWLYFDFLDASAVVQRNIRSGLTFIYAHYFVAAGIAALGVGVRVAIVSADSGDAYAHAGWVVASGAALCMGALGVIQLVTPPTILDADVVLRFATAALGLLLVALTNLISPIVVLWIIVVALVAQVVVELLTHEEHHHETAVSV